MATILSFLLLVQKMQSAESLRFAHVAEQGYDTSCGLTVLSDLLSRYWDYPVSEETLLTAWRSLKQRCEQAQGKNYAISFKDMQDLLAQEGFASKAFCFTYAQLVKAAQTYAPIVLHFADQAGHFVLCLTADDASLVIADPAEGVYWLSRDDLLSRWQGYALLVQRSDQQKNKATLHRILQDTQEKRETLTRLSLIQWGGR
ncbi:MAG: hypothetical protein LDL24_10805 [Treponema sp.]|nr:hypothetical protein [Treponema sp.]